MSLNHQAELDNPIWEALNGPHSDLALGTENAKHYPFDVSGGAGLRHGSDEDLRELATVVPPGQRLAVVKTGQQTNVWTTAGLYPVVQMVCAQRIPVPAHAAEVVTLSDDDVPEMLALVALTEPGPFRQRTIAMGPYIGIRDGGRLVAMAGIRFCTPHFREISAVCTHPERRGKGYASLLVSLLVNTVFDDGLTPFLSVMVPNTGARRLYEKLGFTHYRTFDFLILQRNDARA